MTEDNWSRLEAALGLALSEKHKADILNRFKPDEINSNVPVYRPDDFDKRSDASGQVSPPQIS